MPPLLKSFLSADFIPHGHCYLWKPGLVWLHVSSDLLIALAYYSIPLLLLYLVRHRRDLPFNWVFLLFSSFIIACGTTHLVEIWTLWHPIYWVSGLFKAGTAVISWLTAILLLVNLPKVLALPSPAQLEAANQALAPKIKQHEQAEESIHTLNAELEKRVQDRTAALTWLNYQLQQEICERQRVEENLQLTKFAVDHCADAILWIGVEGQLLYANEAASRTLGYSPQELQALTIHDINPDFPKSAWSLHWSVLRRCGSVNIEAHHRTKTGRFFPVEITINHLKFNNQEYHCAFARDISERKQVEKKLRESKEEFKSLVANIPGAVYRCACDPDWTMAFISEGIESIIGYPPSEFLENHGRSFASVIYPDDQEFVTNVVLNAVAKKQPYIIEYRLLHQDGTVRWVYEKGQAIFGENKQILWLNGAIFDVTERKQSEAEKTHLIESLQESKERLQLALAGTDQGLWDWNLVTGEVYFSEHWHQMLGYAPKQVAARGRSWLRLVHPDDRKRAISVLRAHLAGHTPFFETEYRILTNSRQWKWVLNHGKVVKKAWVMDEVPERLEGIQSHTDPHSEDASLLMNFGRYQPLRMTGTLKDISERKQAEDALRQSQALALHRAEQLEFTLKELQETQAQLIQTEKMSSLGQMVAGVAHEINNPISFIYGNLTYATQYIQDLFDLIQLYQKHYPQPEPEIIQHTEAIDFDYLSEDLLKILSSMKMGADRIREIVLSLRNFSRLDEAEKKPVDIHEGIDNTLLILQNRLRAKGDYPEIRVMKDYGNLPQVECYAGQLNQVFMNLLSNAIDALEETSRLYRADWESMLLSQEQSRGQLVNLEATEKVPFLSCLVPVIQIHTEVVAGEFICIRISDNGQGIKEDVLPRLFDPFFTTKPAGKGTGLGLAISYRIVVEKHGGQLKCHSVPGQGSEFTIEIPLNSKPTKQSAIQQKKLPQNDSCSCLVKFNS